MNNVSKKTSYTCNICAFSFDSAFKECKKCEFYQEGLEKFGHTKSNEECQLEILIDILK